MQPAINPMTGQPLTRKSRSSRRRLSVRVRNFTVIDPYDLLIDPDGGMIAVCVEKSLGELKRDEE
jgi:hypothetical protein